MPSVGGRNMHITNPRWRVDGRRLGKMEKLPCLGDGFTDRHEIWHGDALWPS